MAATPIVAAEPCVNRLYTYQGCPANEQQNTKNHGNFFTPYMSYVVYHSLLKLSNIVLDFFMCAQQKTPRIEVRFIFEYDHSKAPIR